MKGTKNRFYANPDIENRDELMKKSHLLVTEGLITGNLTMQPCEVCGKNKTDAHHDDYNQPLNVRWLCRQHHLDLHNNREMSKNEITKQQIRVILIYGLNGTPIECWGNLKKACLSHGWKYNTLSRKKLPIEYDNCKIHRVRFQ